MTGTFALKTPPLQGRGKGWGLPKEQLTQLQEYASEMRNVPTEPEKRLWRSLSRSQLNGHKFRRQAVIGTYIVDFLCPQKALIVEVDGDTHGNLAADQRRDADLMRLGFRVMRLTNADVMRNIEGVLQQIANVLEAIPDRWGVPHPNPSPEGEGLSLAVAFSGRAQRDNRK